MFHDRFDAGMQLADALVKYKNEKNVIVMVIPRGALQIGQILHEKLGLPLDIIVTKKISHPINMELAIGAVGPESEYVITESAAEIDPAYIKDERRKLEQAIEKKYVRYRGRRKKPDLKDKTVIIVDDGIATASTMIAAIHVIRKQKAAKIVVAVPVGQTDTVAAIAREADEMICLMRPAVFYAVGQFYENFVQVEDEEAIAILEKCQ